MTGLKRHAAKAGRFGHSFPLTSGEGKEKNPRGLRAAGDPVFSVRFKRAALRERSCA